MDSWVTMVSSSFSWQTGKTQEPHKESQFTLALDGVGFDERESDILNYRLHQKKHSVKHV